MNFRGAKIEQVGDFLDRLAGHTVQSVMDDVQGGERDGMPCWEVALEICLRHLFGGGLR